MMTVINCVVLWFGGFSFALYVAAFFRRVPAWPYFFMAILSTSFGAYGIMKGVIY